MKQFDKVTFHIISHTHWDREWYLPFEVFRIELVELIDNLLNILKQNKNFIFHLDGQSIILQDYLEINLQKREEIKQYIKAGNILVGPWYVLSDQFLTSGEATVRNLLYGIRDAKDFGNVMMVGYCPDQFGQIAQLPQIFKGFNIHSVIIGRGIQDSISEHNWYGLNGDKVFAIALTHWYNNAQRFPDEKEKLHRYLDKIYDTQAKTSHSGHILLMNGCDHLIPQENLSEVLKLTNGNQKWQIKHNDLQSAVNNIADNKNIDNYPIYFGELRDDNNKYILAGTLSGRVYLKLENYRCQTKIEKIIEPLSVLLSLNKKTIYPQNHIKHAWKLLMQNHAHDSICGCSVDEVHREMETRFSKVSQVLDKTKENLLSSLNVILSDGEESHNVKKSFANASQGDIFRKYLQVINLTSYQRNETIEARLDFPLGPAAEHPSAIPTINKEKINNISLKSKDKNIDCTVLENHETYKMVRSKDEVPLLQAIQKIKLLFKASIEPYSVCTYEITAQETLAKKKEKTNSLDFENKFYKLKINCDGTLTISLKENSFKFENLHFLSVEDDIGDEYNFVPAKGSKIVLSKDWKWNIEVIEENDLRKRFLLESKDTIGIEMKTEITCYADSGRIEFKTTINNSCKDKRIRLHLPTELSTNCLVADTPFGVLQRARPPIDWINYATSQPLHNWIDHSNDNVGFAFFGGGLAEYELYENGNGFAVTLIRAVGRLSSVKSHSLIETPEAQCNRQIEFAYALYPHLGNWEDAKIQQEQLLYQSPLLTNQSSLQTNIPSLVTVSRDVVVSSFKKAEDKDNAYILRLYNPTNKTIDDCYIEIGIPIKKIFLLTLNEEVKNALNKTNGRINFQVKPYEILTFGFEI